MTDLTNRVALVTGGARGQGRAYAWALAEAGARIALLDLPDDPSERGGIDEVVPYPLATEADLAETAAGIDERGSESVTLLADVRDGAAVEAAVDAAVAQLGRLDIVVTSAGVSLPVMTQDITLDQWDAVVGSNLTGTFTTIRAAVPHLISNGWGRIVTIASVMGRMGNPMSLAYASSKWGVIGLTKSVALDVTAHNITVNAIAPGNVATPMIFNDMMYKLFRPDLEHPTADDAAPIFASLNPQRVPWVDTDELVHTLMFLVDDRAAHITGAVIGVDGGQSAQFT